MNYYLSAFAVILFMSITSCSAPSNGRLKKQTPAPPKAPSKAPCKESLATTKCLDGLGIYLPSMMYRTRGSAQLSQREEQSFVATNTLPLTHRSTPDPLLDNDSHVVYNTHGHNYCGTEKGLETISSRISHCLKVNGSYSIWSGQGQGTSGEGDWKLVLKTKGVTLWVDTRTNLIWSPPLKQTTWDIASGTAPDNENICHELKSTTSDQVSWRLPNRNEFFLADLNGARFALEDTKHDFWTASTGHNVQHAWVIRQSTGTIKLIDKEEQYEVRCIGSITK